MANLEIKLPDTPNNEWVDAQYTFKGAWLPAQDPLLIGPENFATLTNLRYTDGSIEGVNGFSLVNSTAITDYTQIDNGHQLRTTKTVDSYLLAHAVNPATGLGRVYQNTVTLGSTGNFDSTSRLDTSGNSYKVDSSANLVGRFASAPQNSVIYANGEETYVYSGAEHRVAAVFQQKDDSTAAILDVSDLIKSTLTTDYITVPNGTFDELVILTTRPVQGFKFYVKTANAAAGAMAVTYWDGDSWAAVANESDGTDDGGATLGQTGSFIFDHTIDVAKLKHYNELYLFAYKVTLAAGVSAEIYHITCDPAFIPVQNVWDGVYRQPIQFQFDNAGDTEDYTLQVNQSSDLNYPVGAQIDGMLATDELYIMFEERVAGIRFTMLGGLVNKAAATITVNYWDGDSWEAVTDLVDGTKNSGGTKSFNQTGLMSWTPESDEEKQTKFGSLGYCYQLVPSGTLTGTKGGTAEVLIDLCAGVPYVEAVDPCDFSVMYKNRVMLCGFSAEGEGNRMDYSAPNAPDVYNGDQTSNNKFNSVYFGGNEPITGAVQLFNRFGATIFAMLLVFKNTETYIFAGNNPTDFEIYPVSTTIGCPAPLTIGVAEVSLAGEENYARNFAIWLSHSGPVMFDGAVIAPIAGIENYFDPNKTEYINWSASSVIRAWIDPNYKEWNLLIPSGSGQTTVNVWLAYDLKRRKWFRKDSGSTFPLCGFVAMDPSSGAQFSYGGLNIGKLVQLEDGTTFAGAGITQIVKTGDFFPSKNIWDYTLLRKFKIIFKRLDSTLSPYLNVFYYQDGEIEAGQTITWEDADATVGINVSFEDVDTEDLVNLDGVEWSSAASGTLLMTYGINRIIKSILDLNNPGYVHAFKWEVTTTDVQGGFQPILWGLRFRVERKDDTATE